MALTPPDPRHLFLDDERLPAHVTWLALPAVPWTVVRTPAAFREHVLRHGVPDAVSWDNDLADPAGEEGRHLVRWLCDAVLDGGVAWNPATVHYVHSRNTVAAEWILQYLREFRLHREREVDC